MLTAVVFNVNAVAAEQAENSGNSEAHDHGCMRRGAGFSLLSQHIHRENLQTPFTSKSTSHDLPAQC